MGKTKVVAIRRWWVAEYLIKYAGAERLDIKGIGQDEWVNIKGGYLRLDEKGLETFRTLKQGKAPAYRLSTSVTSPAWGELKVWYAWSPVPKQGYKQVIKTEHTARSKTDHQWGWVRLSVIAEGGINLEVPDNSIFNGHGDLKSLARAVEKAYAGEACDWDPNEGVRLPRVPLLFNRREAQGSGVFTTRERIVGSCPWEYHPVRYTMYKTKEEWLKWRASR